MDTEICREKEGDVKRHGEKTAISKRRREAGNTSFPQKGPALPTP